MSPRSGLVPLRPAPDPRPRPWGGVRFGGPDGQGPYGELWVAGPSSRVADPRSVHAHTVTSPGVASMTLDELAARDGPALVGSAGMAALGARFPLLVKMIDPADWLSLQIHPNDEQARSVGDGTSLGKREAWYVVDATPDAQLVVGTRSSVGRAEIEHAIASGHVPFELLETIHAQPGSLIHVPPGTLHAIGPGAFLYEVQQPSDLTLRASDWGRPSRADRPLHIEETIRLLDVTAHAEVVGSADEEPAVLSTENFRLEVVSSEVELRPAGRTVEVVTAAVGSALVEGDGWLEAVDPYQTIVVPASVPRYSIRPAPGARICVATLP